MVGRMSLSVGLDVGQGWTILLLWNPVQGEGGLVYALVYARVDYSVHSPKSDTSCRPPTLLPSPVHPTLENAGRQRVCDRGQDSLRYPCTGYRRISTQRIPS